MKSKKKLCISLLCVFFIMTLASCTAGINELVKVPNSEEYLAGFFRGFWHGLIMVFSFVISLFNDSVSVYEVHNVGPLYDLGFLLGVSTLFGGSGHAGKKCRKK